MNDDERIKKAFDFASETTKQLITLSIAIITVTITFAKDILGAGQIGAKWILVSAWSLYLVSLIAGILTLMALTGQLEPANKNSSNLPSIRGKSVIYCASVQIVSFLLATIAIIIFGSISIFSFHSSTTSKPSSPSSTPSKSP